SAEMLGLAAEASAALGMVTAAVLDAAAEAGASGRAVATAAADLPFAASLGIAAADGTGVWRSRAEAFGRGGVLSAICAIAAPMLMNAKTPVVKYENFHMAGGHLSLRNPG